MDDLNKPLGQGRKPRAKRVEIPYALIAVSGCGVLLASLGVFAMLTDDKFGGEPFAAAKIEKPAQVADIPAPVQTAPANAAANGDVTGSVSQVPRSQSAAAVEQASGVTVHRGGNGQVPGALIIEIPDTSGAALNPAPDKRLVESSRYGLLPKVGADGSKPLLIYAKPLKTGGRLKANAPRIALVFGGLGLAEAQTTRAIENLPEEVTLAFAPYGKGLERQVKQAREGGHEVLLQIPMQAFDYPANNPGPETLLTDADEATNLAHLQALMGKFTGYIGLMTYQGGKFTADRAALAPVLREVTMRGLMMLDDGSSPRSLIGEMAPELSAPTARGEVVVDAQPKAEAIAQALTKLEAKARQNGYAVGVANGYPIGIDQISAWARELESRGFALVPVSAMLGKGARTVAEQVQ